MTGLINFPSTSRFEARFCVVGWNAVENDRHESELMRLRQYAVDAAAAGIEADELTLDILDASGSLFQSVDISYIRKDGGRTVVSVVAMASGTSGTSAGAVDLSRFLA